MNEKALTFFIEDKSHFVAQANHFFIASFEYLQLYDQNFDIVVFGPHSALQKVKNANYIKKIVYDPVSYSPEYHNYHYANSITYISDNRNILLDYDIVLKTDADIFLTEAIINYIPENFTVGMGYYSNQLVQEKLKQESQRFGLKHNEYFNIGATWYGRSIDIINVADLTVSLMLSLLSEHFSKDWGQWPNWYGGVCSMYASDLAINHLISNLYISNKFDCSSAHANIKTNEIITAHCLHTNAMFSKFEFEKGDSSEYANIDLSFLNLDLINQYCTFIAENSRRIK